jgi:PPOX class probable F420-dependent enzyme
MLDDDIKKLADGPNFAAFTTFLPDGDAMTHVMWVGADDECVLINTEVHRQKFRNVQRDPRCTVAIIDHANPYHFAEVRGRVVETITGDRPRAHIDELSRKYLGSDYQPEAITTERVILRIAPHRQVVRG